MLQMFSAFAEFEKSRIIERTKEGLVRARKEGKKLGRPVAADTLQRVQEARAKGLSQSKSGVSIEFKSPDYQTKLEHQRGVRFNLPSLRFRCCPPTCEA
ncbi:serine site-specific recombinase [Escherichia coli]|nr:serine site-specific recombinase [Escherichia coli]